MGQKTTTKHCRLEQQIYTSQENFTPALMVMVMTLTRSSESDGSLDSRSPKIAQDPQRSPNIT